MNARCEAIDAELVGYHFGACAQDVRDEVEAHLISCADCVRRFVALKREIELGEEAPAPSAQVRARIHASVLQALAPEPRVARWWERPVALAAAGAAVALAVVVMHTAAASPGALPRSIREHSPEAAQVR